MQVSAKLKSSNKAIFFASTPRKHNCVHSSMDFLKFLTNMALIFRKIVLLRCSPRGHDHVKQHGVQFWRMTAKFNSNTFRDEPIIPQFLPNILLRISRKKCQLFFEICRLFSTILIIIRVTTVNSLLFTIINDEYHYNDH